MKQKLNQRGRTSQKGITLIALVITIIVLLILAGVTINMVLGDNGIIGQAQGAKTAQTKAEEEQAIKVAVGEAKTSEYMGTLTKTQMESYKKDGTSVFTFTNENPYNNSVREVKTLKKENADYYLPIPKGMAYAFGTDVDEGVVVVDGLGNEFVWVPVPDPTNDTTGMFTKSGSGATTNYESVLKEGYNRAGIQTLTGNEPSNIESDSIINLSEWSNDLFQTEYNDMAKSVEIYKGFYIGRYETSNKYESKKGETAVNNVNWYRMYTNQKGLHKKEDTTKGMISGMIYGSQWDAIMDWMKNIDNLNVSDAKYISNSTKMGNYGENAILTGSKEEYKVKNVYDLAGNYFEWTQEANGIYRIFRGGSYMETYGEEPASYRSYDYYSNEASPYYSSRLQLYVK